MELETKPQEEAIVQPYAGSDDSETKVTNATEEKNPWITKYSYLIEKGEAAAKARKMSPEEKWEMFSMACPEIEICATSFAVMDKKALSSFGRKLVKLKTAEECAQFCAQQKAEYITNYTSVTQLAELIDCAWGDVDTLIQIKKIVALNPSIQKGKSSSILDAISAKFASKEQVESTAEGKEQENTPATEQTMDPAQAEASLL